MHPPISDFSALQQDYVANLLAQRYGKEVDLQLADSELQLDLLSEELTVCPTLYWSERGAQFVVYKVDENRLSSSTKSESSPRLLQPLYLTLNQPQRTQN